jgi:hypothetical protein
MRHSLFAGLLWIAFAAPAHAQSALGALQSSLVGSWLTTVEGEQRTRILVITGISAASTDTFDLNASYGWSDGAVASLREAEVRRSGKSTEIRFITGTSATIVATLQPDGTYSGTFTFKNGKVKPVKLERTADRR